MFQAIQIETQAEQQGLTLLRARRTARCTSREVALYRREQRFDQGPAPIEPLRERPPHLGANFAHSPGFLAALGRDHALRPELLPDIGVIPLAVELGVSQHQPGRSFLRSRFDDGGPIRAVVPGAASRALRQQELLIQIHHDHPLQPVPPRQRFLPVGMQAPHKERADRSLREACCVDGYANPPVAAASRTAQPAHRLPDRPINGLVVQTLQETIQSREIGHTHEPPRLAQFAVLAQAHLGFAKGPVLLPHPTENGQQLRLRKLVVAETASAARKHRPGDLQGEASERQESDFGHDASCLGSKQQIQRTGYLEVSLP